MSARPTYPLDQSPLFRLPSKRRAAEVLGIDLHQIEQLVGERNYRVFVNAKGRTIQHPVGELAGVHKRIASLLGRLDVPSYVRSVKGESYVSNAGSHVGNGPLIKTDIAQFYPGTNFSAVYGFFRRDMGCAPDVAHLLARLCCFRQRHLPTGSYLSGPLAFFAHRAMFDQIYCLAQDRGCVMTCYVDDIVISGPGASKELLFRVRGLIRAAGRTSKDDKSKTFPAHKPKTVTGVIVTSDALRLPNSRHKQIHEARAAIRAAGGDGEQRSLRASLRGRLQEAGQIANWNVRNPGGVLVRGVVPDVS